MIVVEIKIRVAAGRSSASRNQRDAAVAEEHVLTPPAMVGAVAFTDHEEVLRDRAGRRSPGSATNGRPPADRRARRRVPIADVVGVIPAEHAPISCGIGLADLVDLVKARKLFHELADTGHCTDNRAPRGCRARPRREASRRTSPHAYRTDAPADRARNGCSDAYCRQAVAQLLQVENTSGLIHAFTRAVDRGQAGSACPR